ncbi:fumarate reductase/succinate dehydrogenase flavoprotein subunit [Catenulispora pinisilvae]|uniref:fumarate reductase/succinate dehydrogenase flavoprotein subunit n=1 Tax=Catenulispora pinisilvae TaxID=2705253 RepID=UPI001E29EE6F|nr:fumarate reductase/succinate dehydrogenase flavoprotein subunit [Catenulispora pinisilvae]
MTDNTENTENAVGTKSTEPVERHSYDVVVIGAGGAGLRAAIEARHAGKRVAVISKSLFGKAHTVMAEGGAAAAMGNVNPKDNWQVHFRDTMRGGKFLNHFRMAELHAKEAPDRIWELETWGALFDRTKEGKISQRNFGGHEYPRLAHVGDRTGLELIRTLQQRVVALQQEDKASTGDYEANLRVFAETTIVRLLKDASGRIAGAVGYYRETGQFVVFEAPAVIMATGGIGRSYTVTSNSWEYTGDGHALALLAGAALVNMEFVQFHPTGMVWPPSVKGILVTESVRGDGGVLRNSEGKRFMFDYVPDVFRKQYAETEEEADRWYDDQENNRRPPELLPRDEVARSINSEVKAGRGTPNGGVFLDVSTRLPAEEIRRRLPSMYHQFKELADVDITAQPMEVGPTCHYVMGGIEVDPDTQGTVVPGLYAAGECSGGMHGSNRLGGNSLSDLLVFGRRAGLHAAEYIDGLGTAGKPAVAAADVDAALEEALAPLANADGENPYTLHHELQVTMNTLVGIIRKPEEVSEALTKLEEFKPRRTKVGAAGGRRFNPGWHVALDLRNMLIVSECVAKAALEREESRGGHTRDDHPAMSSKWRQINLICSLNEDGSGIDLKHQPIPTIRPDLLGLFEVSELQKYFTDEELTVLGDSAEPVAEAKPAGEAKPAAEPEVKSEPATESKAEAKSEPEAKPEAKTEPAPIPGQSNGEKAADTAADKVAEKSTEKSATAEAEEQTAQAEAEAQTEDAETAAEEK